MSITKFQDIQQCVGPLEFLNELNADGRAKIATLKSNIEHLTEIAECERNKHKRDELLADIDNYKGQLATTTAAFRKANVVSACAIDKMSRDELLTISPEQQDIVRKRRDKYGAVSASSNITERLLDISKHLAETTQRSADTLDTLGERCSQ